MSKISRTILICLVLAFPALSKAAAVTEDNTSRFGAASTISGLTSISWSHTVNSCTNCALYVGISTYTQAFVGTSRVSSVTYGMQTLTAVGSVVSPAIPPNPNSSAELYRLTAPAVGTATITVTFFPAVNYTVGAAISLNNVSQTTPNSAFSSNNGNSTIPTVAATGSVAGDLALDILAATPNSGFMLEGSGQTVCTDIPEETCTRGRGFFFNSFDVGALSRKQGQAGSTPMSWTLTTAGSWAIGAVTVKQSVPTAAAASVSGRIMNANGRGVSNARVILQNSEVGSITAITNPFGYYRLIDVPVGRTYAISITSKRYNFAPRILTVTEDMTEVNFTAEP